MATDPNEYQLVTFDPGGATGWTWFVLDCHAFSRPENKVLANIKSWDCGEFSGTEHEQCTAAVHLINSARYGEMPFNSRTDVVSEDFDLTQMVGGSNLLIPVRINAVLAWECNKLTVPFHLQNRVLRTGITRERLTAFGFAGRFRKDEFAAMQHALTWLRMVKQKSLRRPWKMSNGVSSNAYWDCSCRLRKGRKCDLAHPN